MLEESKTLLADAQGQERIVSEIIALRYLASELEQNLLPADEAASTAQARRDAGDEIWVRTVFGVLQGLRAAETQGYRLQGA